jgi:urease accessory protein
MTVRAATAHDMVRGAFHLGNRHVALELGPDYLRLAPDPVLAGMVVGLGLTIVEEVAPFYPEPGAYGAGHGHSHGHSH